MKTSFADDIRNIIRESKSWISLEIEYAKLTVAEKVTMLMSTLIIGFVCLLLGLVVLICIALALAEVFKLFLNPGLAYLSVGGIFCLLVVLLYLFRKPILFNPIAKLLTRIFFEKKQ